MEVMVASRVGYWRWPDGRLLNNPLYQMTSFFSILGNMILQSFAVALSLVFSLL